jgi:uncharacterized protein (DUF1800 family)
MLVIAPAMKNPVQGAGILFAFALTAALALGQTPRLQNLSTRGQVQTGSDIMITGLVIGPGTPDTVLIRADGPALTALGVTGVLAQPILSLYNSSGTLMATNQGWSTGNATAAIMSSAGAFALTPGSADSALVATLPAGSYTAQVSGANGSMGVAIIEVYEVSPTASTARLANLSTRGVVGTGSTIMIPGLSISAGTGTRTLLLRADGPALGTVGLAGFLADPSMSVTNSAGVVVASNDNWGTPIGNAPSAATMSAVFSQFTGLPFAAGSLDSAVIASFAPGNYTVQVSGNNGTSGLCLVEVYDITPSAPGAPDVVTIAATDPGADTSGNNTGTFTLTRTGDTSGPLTVSYAVGGTAVNGIDYQGLSGSVTFPAYVSSVPVTVAPNPTLSTSPSSTVVLTLGSGSSYTVGSPNTATVTISNVPTTLYIAQLRPTSGAANSAGSGVATILISADGTLASVSVSFSNLSSDEVVGHLAIGGDMNNGTYVLNLPNGQVSSLAWTPTASGAYSAAQVVSALQSGNLYVEIDSATYPSGELGGQFITGAGSQVFTPPAAPPAINLSTVSAADAPRFLTQATFGPTTADIATLQSQGYSAWITNQMALPETSHRAATDADANAFPPTGTFVVTQNNRQAAWWKIVLTAPDQLRQRVAFALSEIFVTSDVASQLANVPDGLANYNDLLANDAFGNFRTLLQDVTLSPAMGNYLNMLENAAANPAKGTAADENYAREVQQLFTIGLNELQPDGTLMLDSSGLPIPTYTQNEIVQTANVFTGWGYYSTATNPSFYGTAANFDQPMQLYPTYHDNTQKTIINNIVLPANQGGAADLKAELDALFNHPNTGPFICSQLIQRLVTSNPSPGYVYRVAQVFANDGTGTRGNMAAVVKAILLDYEARSLTEAALPGYGKLKEPLLRMTSMYRAFGAAASDGRYAIFSPQTNLDEAALRSPTVFNFFDPGYVQQGALASAGLLAPEFEITTASTAISVPNNIYSAIYYSTPPAATTIALNLTSLTANATNPTAMVATLNQLLCANMMTTQTQQSIAAAVMGAPAGTSTTALAQEALYLAATSPDVAIQR